MKILALNSSPRVGSNSVTELLLDRLVSGMRDSGADVEVVNLRDKTIKKRIVLDATPVGQKRRGCASTKMTWLKTCFRSG